MSKEKFTPGPWGWSMPDEVFPVVFCNETGNIIADLNDPENKQREMVANAKLIAAAPELYYALKNLKECLESYFGKTEKSFFEDCEPEDDELFFAREYNDACNALEKARGER